MSDVAETREQLLGQIDALQARLDELDANETPREGVLDRDSDIAERQLAEAALRESEARYRGAFDLNPAMMMLMDVKSRTILDVNQAYQRRLGQRKEDIVGIADTFGFTVAGASGKDAWIQSILERDSLSDYELTLVTGDNEEIVVLMFAEPMELQHRRLHVITCVDITKLKKAEALLVASEARFRTLVENSYDVINMFSREGQLLYTSPSIERVLGYRPDEMKNVHPLDLIHPRDAERGYREFRSCLENPGAVSHFTLRLRHKGGSYRTVEITGTNLLDEPGINAMVSVFHDITVRKQAEDSLIESEERLRQIAANIHEVFWLTDWASQKVLYVSPAVKTVWGIDEQDLYAGPLEWTRYIHPDDRDRVEESFLEQAPVRKWAEEYRILRPDGTERWISDRAFPIFDESGEVVRLAGISEDITQRKQAERDLERRLRFEALLSRISSTLINLPASEIDAAINSGLRLLGEFMDLERAGINLISEDRTQFSVTHEWCVPELEPVMQRFQNVPLDSVPWARDHWLRGEVFHVPKTSELPEAAKAERKIAQLLGTRSSISIPIIVGGQVWGMVDFHTVGREREWPVALVKQHRLVGEFFANALARKRAESQLQTTQAILSAAIEASPAGIIIADAPDVRIRSVNSAALGIRNAPLDELIDIPVELHPQRWRWSHPDGTPFAPQELPLSRAVLEGTVSKNVDVIIERADGERQWVLGNAAPVRDADGEIVAGVVVFPDITEQKLAEASLRKTESELAHVARVSSIGEMVGGLAHELNQPLYTIQNYGKACGNLLGDDGTVDRDQLREWLDEITSTAEYAGEVLLRLRSFVDRVPSEKAPVDLGETIGLAISLVQHEARQRGIAIEHRGLDTIPVVLADAVQMQQVLVNLLRNSLEATQRKSHGDSQIAISADIKHDLIEVAVADNGPGLPSERDLKIFEAFNSTKPDGMGLGLAISKTIVEAHGGTLVAQNRTEGGAVFRFTLPIHRRD